MPSSPLDDHGQPRETGFCWRSRADRGMNELIGICRGILADGVLVQEEAEFVLNWLRRSEPVRTSGCGQEIYRILMRALADGTMDSADEEQIIRAVHALIGGTPTKKGEPAESYSAQLPLDTPEPSVCIGGNSFCFTGKFEFGKRSDCEGAAERLGGTVHSTVRKGTTFLVIGTFGSRDWAHSSMGRKIEAAMELRKLHGLPRIISEELFVRCACAHTNAVLKSSAESSPSKPPAPDVVPSPAK